MAKSNTMVLPLVSMAGVLAIVYYLYTKDKTGTFHYENFVVKKKK